VDVGGGWKRSVGKTRKQMKRYYNWYKKKKPHECDHVKKEEKLDRSYTQR